MSRQKKVCQKEKYFSSWNLEDDSNLEVSFKIGAWKDSEIGCFSHRTFCFAEVWWQDLGWKFQNCFSQSPKLKSITVV